MRSDSVKNMSACADQNHAPSLTDVRLEYCISDKSAYRHNWKIRPQQSAIFLTDIFFTYDLNMVSIFNKYLPLYYNEAIRKI